jgi:Zn-dependent protease/predicted transcriptional regulator
MKWSLSLGKVAGIQLSVHWTFIILIGWIFLTYYRIGNSTNQAIMGVLFILALFVCVTLHELGHALTAKRFKIITKSITLLPIGGLAQMEKLPEKPSQELSVAIAGPLVNIVISVILFLYLQAIDGFPTSEQLMTMEYINWDNFVFNLFVANLVLAAFNLIPAFPMDGGRVLRALLATKYNREKATKIAAGIGQFLAILFVFLGIFANVWLVFIGIFIFLGAGAEASFESTKSILTGHTVRDVLMKQFTRLSPHDKLAKAVQLLLNGQEEEFVITEQNQVVGILTRKELIEGLAEYGKESAVANVMCKDYLILSPNMPLQEVYQKLMAHACAVAPVLKNGNLIGLVDLKNINELIMIKEAEK